VTKPRWPFIGTGSTAPHLELYDERRQRHCGKPSPAAQARPGSVDLDDVRPQ